MLRLGRLTGLPVVLNGCVIGYVEQSVLSEDGKHLRGLTVRKGFGSAKWIPRTSVCVLGDAAVIAARAPERMPRDCHFTLGVVFDAEGLPLGCVTDVYISRTAMTVQALEISLGPVETFRRGRYIVRSFSVSDASDRPGAVLIPCGCVLERPESEVIQ